MLNIRGEGNDCRSADKVGQMCQRLLYFERFSLFSDCTMISAY